MSQSRRKVLAQSFDWIRAHARASTHDVPEELLYLWMFDADEDQQRPKGFHFAVFAFGRIQHDVLNSRIARSEPRTIALNRLLEQFERWQLKLALAEIHRRSDYAVEALPLFDYPEDEEIKVWPRSL